MNDITHMLVDLGINSRSVYEEDFERHFLETSANFYRVESQEFIASNSCPDYMKKVCRRVPFLVRRLILLLLLMLCRSRRGSKRS
jgi:cullin 3